jgi:hypothetical protein
MPILINDNTARVQYTATAGQTVFIVPYEFFEVGDLKVYNGDTLLAYNVSPSSASQYSVTGAGVTGGGSITLGAPGATISSVITIVRDIPIKRITDFPNAGPFNIQALNTELDKLTAVQQNLETDLDNRVLRLGDSDTPNTLSAIPNKAARQNKLLGFDVQGQPVAYDTASLATLVAYATAFADTFTGDGIDTTFTLSGDPAVIANLDVSINGVTQVPLTDYTLSGTTLTTTTPVPNGAVMLVKFKEGLPNYSGDAQDIRYTAGFSGAVQQNVKTKLEQYVSVKDFGAVGDGVTNDTAAVQAAIDSGEPIVFPAGSYACGPLTQSTNSQRFYADGFVNIQKNANGVLFTSTGNYVQFEGIQFIGTGFTGDNVNLTGNHPTLTNCASFGTPGRALKATGAHVQIFGTCGIYATTDATASGFDIEIGVSGTATLYHQLMNVYTSQATGGILLTDVGSHVIVGGQFGKLSILSGTSPAGVNGGITSNARILGNVTVNLSNSAFSANQFSNQTITFGSGTSGHSFDTSNTASSATIVNSGNAASPIFKSIGTGSPSGIVLQYGSDAFNSTIRYSNDEIYFQDAQLYLSNNKALWIADSAGVYKNTVSLSSGDDFNFGNDTGANFTNLQSGSGGIYHVVSGANVTQTATGVFRPVPDGSVNLGGASNRWATVYATTGTINTSDANDKKDIRSLSDKEKAVGVALRALIRAYKWKAGPEETYVGIIAQDVIAAFDAEGLDVGGYGIIDDSGDRLGVRYDQVFAFIIGAL